MRAITQSWKWIRSIARRRVRASGFEREMRRDDRRQALIEFGGLQRHKEGMQDGNRPALLEDSVRDLRHGVRVLGRAPGFAAAALVTLGLGIGATAAIFSVVRTVMLEPLPYHEPDRIVSVWETNRGGTSRNVIAPANFAAWRERARTLEHLGMVGPASAAMIINGQPLQVAGLTVSADVFRALGIATGLVAAAALTRLLERLLYEVEPLDPWTFAVTALVLLIVATVASCVPARRDMHMAPVDALRTN